MGKSINLYTFVFTAIILAIFNTGFVYAQPGQGPRGGGMMPDSARIVQMVDDLAKAVSLTKEQKEKVTPIYFNHFSEMRQMREKSQGDRSAMRESMDKLRTKLDQDIKALLTDNQKKDYEKFTQEQRERRGRGGHGPR